MLADIDKVRARLMGLSDAAMARKHIPNRGRTPAASATSRCRSW